MAFKIKDGIRIGTVDVFNNSGVLQVKAPSADKVNSALTIGAGLSGTSYDGSSAITIAHSNSVTAGTASEGGSARTLAFGGTFNIPSVTYDANGHITGKGSITLTMPAAPAAANDGTLTLNMGTAGATNTTVTVGTGTGFSANTATNATYQLKVGPALTNLAALMTTAGAGFIKRGATADTYTIDTSTYLTANQSITVSGDASGTGSTAITLTLATVNSNVGTFNNVTVNAKGLVTAASNVSYLTAEADTLQTVTGRGASSNVATISLTGNTSSSSTGTGTLVVTGGVGISENANIGGNLVVTGNLTVNGTTTTINVDTVTVEDKNIVLGNVTTPTDTTADGGGITVKGATDKTFNWVNSTAAWTSSEHIALAAGKDIILNGATSGAVTLNAPDVAGSTLIAFPATSGTVALTSQIITPSNGTFTLTVDENGTTGNSVYITTGTGFSANDGTNRTYDIHVGPALKNLADLMTTAGAGFIKRGATADTYTIDTSTYLTSQSTDFKTVTITDTDSGYTWTDSGSAVAETVGDTLTIVSGQGVEIDVAAASDALRIRGQGSENAFAQGMTASVATPVAGTAYTIDTWAKATYRAAKYIITVTQGTFYQSSEIMVFNDGTTSGQFTEYATFSTAAGSEVTFSIDASGTDMLLKASTPTATTALSFKIHRIINLV